MKRKSYDNAELEIAQDQSGWFVRTSFLKNSVGNYLGPNEGLSKVDAELLLRKWISLQQRKAQEISLEALARKRSPFLKHE